MSFAGSSLKATLRIAIAGSLLFSTFWLHGQSSNFTDVKPSPQQVQWQDLRFGVLISFGTNTFLNREWGDGTASPGVFNPTDVNPDQWMRAVKAAGATYVILVAKHHDGFCLWPTAQTDYSVKESPWMHGKGDLVGMVADAAKRNGLKFGIYLSPWDRHDPRYSNPAEYDKYYLSELDELAQHYGNLVEFWLDGAGSAGHTYNFPKIIDELRTYQPNTLVFADTALFKYGDIRWVGNEDGDIDFENWNVIDRHGYLRWRPVEADTPLHKGHWFWHPDDVSTLKSVPELVQTYEQTVGHGGQLVLGIAPDRRGLLPDADVRRLKEFGDAIRQRYADNLVLSQHGRAIGNTDAAFDGDPNTFWSASQESHHATLEVDFSKPVTFNHTLTMEWLNDGQHVEKYAVQIWDGSAWKTVVESHAIGHEKIDNFATVHTTRVRLNILSSSTAHIREFQIYNIGLPK